MTQEYPNIFRNCCLALLAAALSACASVDFDYPKAPSQAIQDTEDTAIGAAVDPYEELHPEQSGFRVLSDGIDALAARLVMAQGAEQTIDAQYYLITDDSIGFVFIGALLKAADRGVRVRLLIDDIQTSGYDAGLAALDSHPNLEVRVFNPWDSRTIRYLDLFKWTRLNRRMHNKSFTIDNQLTIIGGRNIADEYFGARSDVNFGDVDVLAVGPVVRDVSEMFDTYWNHQAAAPVPAFARMPDDPDAALEELRERIIEETIKVAQTQYAEAVNEDYRIYVSATMDLFTWADYELAYDSPDKVYKKQVRDGEVELITSKLGASVATATNNLIVISPYFVPRKSGIEYLSELQGRGVQVSVVTNSLAANNHYIVHSGYAPSRKKLLEAGVKLYEVAYTAGLDGIERGGTGAELATLHTKAFVVDCREVFVGSFNWDPRSAYLNTELGVIVRSDSIGQDVCAQLDEALPRKTYEVILNDKGDLEWIESVGPAAPVTYDKEPDTSWWLRFKVGFLKLFPIKSQL